MARDEESAYGNSPSLNASRLVWALRVEWVELPQIWEPLG